MSKLKYALATVMAGLAVTVAVDINQGSIHAEAGPEDTIYVNDEEQAALMGYSDSVFDLDAAIQRQHNQNSATTGSTTVTKPSQATSSKPSAPAKNGWVGNVYYKNNKTVSGYVQAAPGGANGGYLWLENGRRFSGFRFYMGTYYWFNNGVRQNAGWRTAWGLKYYTNNDGRAVQGNYIIDGKAYNFGNNSTFFLRGNVSGYVDAGQGWKWYENGSKFTGFRFYMGTYYWFTDGVRQDNGWRTAWGLKYYTDNTGRAVQGTHKIGGKNYFFGNDGTFFLR